MEQNATLRMGTILREAREASARTQEHLADEAALSVKTVQRAESTGVMSAETMRALCSVLELDAGEVRTRAGTFEERVAQSIDAWRGGEDVERVRYLAFSSKFWWLMIPAMFTMIFVLMVDNIRELPQSQIDAYVIMTFTDIMKAAPLIILGMGMAWHHPYLRVINGWGTSYNVNYHLIPGSLLSRLGAINGAVALAVFVALMSLAIARQGLPIACSMVGLVAGIACFVQMAITHFAGRQQARYHRNGYMAFVEKMPGLLEAMRAGLASSTLAETVVPLIDQALALGITASRIHDVEPLAYLREDVVRGISGRRALGEYLVVARAMCLREPPAHHPLYLRHRQPYWDDRVRQDGARATLRLRERVSMFA